MATRRGFMGGLALTIAAAARHAEASAVLAAAGTPPAFAILGAGEARDIEAFTAAIVPSGPDGPGAREAGVVYFIDRAFGSFFAGMRAPILRDLAALPRPFPDFATLEGQPLFEQLRFLTVLGLFASPAYGGNRDQLGWQLIGFEDTHAYQPPFGWYDRDYPGYSP